MIRSNAVARYQDQDDKPMITVRRDFSGGINTRQHAMRIAENQTEDLTNFDIGVPGEIAKVKGLTLVEALGTKVTGTATTDTTNKVIAAASTFISSGITAGMKINNTTDDIWGVITSVDTETQLTCNIDVCPDGDENFSICISPGTGLFGFQPTNSTTNYLVASYGTNIATYVGSGSFVVNKNDFTTNLQTGFVHAQEAGEGDVLMVGNGTDHWFRFNTTQLTTLGSPQDLDVTASTGSDSPPISTVGLYYRNRWWVLKEVDNKMGNLWYSDAYPANYAVAFDTQLAGEGFRIPCGTHRALIGLRDQGIIVIGADSIWGINPSTTPAGTDKPEKILDIGCVANKTAVQVGDDVLFLAADGVRGVFRTQQDKLQLGQSFPESYALKTQFESISWAYISKACAIWYDNKYFLALPTGASTYNNTVWVYYPATKSWIILDDWDVAAWAKVKFNGEERLYAIDSTGALVYRAWYGTTMNGSALTATFVGREEDMGAPLQYKNGGELEVETEAAGSGDSLTVEASINGDPFVTLGTISLTSAGAPILPINLPFNLADSYVIREKFHLESLGPWKTLQIKVVNSDDNSDPIKVYSYSIVTFIEEYQNE